MLIFKNNSIVISQEIKVRDEKLQKIKKIIAKALFLYIIYKSISPKLFYYQLKNARKRHIILKPIRKSFINFIFNTSIQ